MALAVGDGCGVRPGVWLLLPAGTSRGVAYRACAVWFVCSWCDGLSSFALLLRRILGIVLFFFARRGLALGAAPVVDCLLLAFFLSRPVGPLSPILMHFTTWSCGVVSESDLLAMPSLPHLVFSCVRFARLIGCSLLCRHRPHTGVYFAIGLLCRSFLHATQMMADHPHPAPGPAYPFMQITSRVRLAFTSRSICSPGPVLVP